MRSLTKTALEAFKAHAAAEFPREACGLLIAVDGRETYVPCRNQSDAPTVQFKLHPEDYLAADRRGKVLAVGHSHTNGNRRPTSADLAACELTQLPWYLISWPDATLTCFHPTGYKAPLLERIFVHGVHDCYALGRDYYAEKLGITLPDFPREDNWWNLPLDENPNLYLKHFADAGFSVVNDLREHDAVLMQFRAKVPNHAAIYVGNDKILHHRYGQLSRHDVYGGYWAKHTTHILRHKDLA